MFKNVVTYIIYMFVEIRKAGKRKKYYLVHSFRHGKKVRKLRRYLGGDLSGAKLAKLRKVAEKQLMHRIAVFRKINDPMLEVLSEHELAEIKGLEAEKGFKIFHLSEKQWEKFSEIFTYNTNAIEGSELSQREVNGILEEGKWPGYGGVPLLCRSGWRSPSVSGRLFALR